MLEKNWPQWRQRANDFETKFVADILTRYRVYGSQITMSARQRNLLTEIYDKVKE